MEENNTIKITGTVDGTIYAKGDTCLLINPFDTYHLFRIYNNWNTDAKSLLNLSDGEQKLYLVFKNKKTELRIPEFVNSGDGYQSDKANGEVLFKISKENAGTILAMSNNVFYITRVFECYDENGKLTYTSGEEVIFTGNWADENKWTGASLTATIESLKKQLESANAQILDLTKLASEYLLKIESQNDEIKTLKERVSELEAENESLQSTIDSYDNANEFTSVVISDNAVYQYYKDNEEDMITNPLSKQLENKELVYNENGITRASDIQMTEKQMSDMINTSSLNAVGSTRKTTEQKLERVK